MVTVADVNFYRKLYSDLTQRTAYQIPFREGEIHKYLLEPCNEIIRNRIQIDTNMINSLYVVIYNFYRIIISCPDTDEGADWALNEINKTYNPFKNQLSGPLKSLFVNLVIIVSDDAFEEKRRLRNNVTAD